MKKTLITLIAVALLAPMSLMAQGGPPDSDVGPQGRGCNGPRMGQGHPGPGGGGCGMMEGRRGFGSRGDGIGHLLMLGDKIELTDAQRDRLQTMQSEFQMEQIDRRAELQKAQLELRTLMRKDDASEADVMAAIDKVSGLKAKAQKMRFQHRKSVQAVLTGEQVEKLKELRKESFQSQCDGDGPKGHRGGGGHGGWGQP